MKTNRRIILTLLTLWLLSTLLLPSGAAFPASSVEGLVSPYFFNLPRWEAANLWDLLWNSLSGLRENNRILEQADLDLVKEYFRLSGEIRGLQSNIQKSDASSLEHQQVNQIESQIQALRQERRDREARVKTIITRQIGRVLSGEEILPLPPVVFAFDKPPRILVISPRDRINLEKTILLEPTMNPENAVTLEQKIESLAPRPGGSLGVSALVEELGGLAVYPSLVPETSTLEQTIPTVAHEWIHQYLFFHPLGQKYGASYEMTTINETVADIAGDEIGERVLAEYGVRLEKGQKKKPSGFDFNQEMRQTRLRVDELLARGQVLEAERYMEERRQLLAREGYYLRRLNQAYFAFHGSYGDTPASTSPVAGWLRSIRARSPSLGDFLREVAQISRYEELEQLATR